MDIVEEGVDIVRAAAEQDLVLRLFGGIGIRVQSPGAHAAFDRSYNDLDFVAGKGSSNRVAASKVTISGGAMVRFQ